jgi:hypothetical protein
MWERSTLVRGARWLCQGRIIRRMLIVLVWVATLVALFYGEENWRGRRAWTQYRQEIEAQGASLDFRVYWPKPVPDEQNFASTPAIKLWFAKPNGVDQEARWSDPFALANKQVPSSRHRKSQLFGQQFMDLVAWDRALTTAQAGAEPRENQKPAGLDRTSRAKAALGVLAGLRTNEALIAELRAASQRPSARYPLDYQVEFPRGIYGPHYNDLSALCMRMELRTCAELAAGRSEAALADVKLMLYLMNSIQAEPLLMPQWMRIHLFPKIAQPIWEGLAEHAWSPNQLRELIANMQRLDFLAACKLGFDGERAATLWSIDCIPKSFNAAQLVGSLNQDEAMGARLFQEELAQLICWSLPRGWFDWEKLGVCQLYQANLGSGFDPAGKRMSPAQIQDHLAAADRLWRELKSEGKWRGVLRHQYAAATLVIPSDFQVIRKFCFMQASADLAIQACALELYRLDHSEFPDKLEAMLPRYLSQLPRDAITGENYKYRRDEPGQFELYSVGWNETDDAGVVAYTRSNEVDLKNGDWVWAYPSAVADALSESGHNAQLKHDLTRTEIGR